MGKRKRPGGDSVEKPQTKGALSVESFLFRSDGAFSGIRARAVKQRVPDPAERNESKRRKKERARQIGPILLHGIIK